MRGLRRKMILTWMSGLLCAISITLWARGNWVVDDLTLLTPYHATSVVSANGGLHLIRLLFHFEQPEWMSEQGLPAPRPQADWKWDYVSDDADNAVEHAGNTEGMGGRWGFWFVAGWHAPRWNAQSPPYPDDGWNLRLPWWSIVLITGAMPLMRLVAFARREKKQRKGYCPECGYDLRATPRRCPECGYMPRG